MKTKNILLAVVLIFFILHRMTAQPLFERTTYPPASIDPIVHTTDPGVTNALEWSTAAWIPAWAGWGDATIYTQSREGWTALCPTGSNTYGAVTLFELDAASDLRVQQLQDYASFEINYSGTTVTVWIFGNDDCPAASDFRWIGASGIARPFINDEPGFLVRLNNDPSTDRQFFNSVDVSPGDANFNFNNWYGVFGHYSFNNLPFVNGLPNSRPWNHENYELCFRGLRDPWTYCSDDVVVNHCKQTDNGWINGFQKIYESHIGDTVPWGLTTIRSVVYSPAGESVTLPFIFVNYTETTLNLTYTVTSSLGSQLNPSSGNVQVPPHGEYETEITALSIAEPGLADTIKIKIRESPSNRFCQSVIIGASPPSRIDIFPGDFTVNQGQTVYVGAIAYDEGDRPLPIHNPVWNLTGGLTTLTGLPGHLNVPDFMQVAKFSPDNEGEGDIMLQSGSLTGLIHVHVIPAAPLSLTSSVTDISCYGHSDGAVAITPDGGVQPFSYLWSTGATTAWVTGLSAGTYSVSVTDAVGTSTWNMSTIYEPAELACVPYVYQPQCPGEYGSVYLSISGGTYPYTVTWDNSMTGEYLYLLPGTYTYMVTDSHGCTMTDIIVIQQPAGDPISVSFLITPATCPYVSDGSIDQTVTGGVLPYTFYWSNNQFTEDATDLLPGFYSVMIMDSGGCHRMETYEVGFTNPVCETITVSGEVYDGQSVCYHAQETLWVAGTPPVFTVWPGGEADLISGGRIVCRPGTTVHGGGRLHAYCSGEPDECHLAGKNIVIAAYAREDQAKQSWQPDKVQNFFKVYPNPTTGILTLEFTGIRNTTEAELALYNLTGEKVLLQKLDGQAKYELSLGSFPPGIYLMRIVSGKETGMVKIIRQ